MLGFIPKLFLGIVFPALDPWNCPCFPLGSGSDPGYPGSPEKDHHPSCHPDKVKHFPGFFSQIIPGIKGGHRSQPGLAQELREFHVNLDFQVDSDFPPFHCLDLFPNTKFQCYEMILWISAWEYLCMIQGIFGIRGAFQEEFFCHQRSVRTLNLEFLCQARCSLPFQKIISLEFQTNPLERCYCVLNSINIKESCWKLHILVKKKKNPSICSCST